jgi:hypothetical protein
MIPPEEPEEEDEEVLDGPMGGPQPRIPDPNSEGGSGGGIPEPPEE